MYVGEWERAGRHNWRGDARRVAAVVGATGSLRRIVLDVTRVERASYS